MMSCMAASPSERIDTFLSTGEAECIHHGKHPEWKFVAQKSHSRNPDLKYRNLRCRKCERERTNRWRAANQDKIRQFYATISGRSQLLYHSAKDRATKRGLEFSIDQKWIEQLFLYQNNECSCTGIPFDMSRMEEGGQNPYAPSLDRNDPAKGYTRENTRLVLWVVNNMKRDLEPEVFISLCARVVNNARTRPPGEVEA